MPMSGIPDTGTVAASLPLGLSTFVLASPFSDADLGLFDRVRAWGYDQVEVCVEDPSVLSAPVAESMDALARDAATFLHPLLLPPAGRPR
jgi:hypothetical protein